MSSVSVEVHGKRHVVHVSPMAPLAAVATAALTAAGVTADPAACQLRLGAVALDPATPLRFANLPAGAKLQLVTGQKRRLGMGKPTATPRLPESLLMATSCMTTSLLHMSGGINVVTNSAGQERRLGIGEPIAAPRLPESPTKASGRSPRAADAAGSPYTMAPSAMQMAAAGGGGGAANEISGGGGGGVSGVGPSNVPGGSAIFGDGASASAGLQAPPAGSQTSAADGAAGAAPAAAPAAASGQHPADAQPQAGPSSHLAAGGAGAGLAAAASPAAAAANAKNPDAAHLQPQPNPGSEQLLGRPAFVFSLEEAREAEAATSSSAPDDPPDSFYEFTADDYARVARGWGANAAGPPAHAPLKTAKLRAAEAAAAMEKAGPIPVRVLGFTGGLALQAIFPATSPVSALQDLVARAVPPSAVGLHIYTAPPKAVLQQPQASLYEAGLAPAAVVYVGCTGDGAPTLRPEVAALQGSPPSRDCRQRGGRGGGKRAAEATQGPAAAAATQQGGEPKAQEARSASGAKLPKWLKPKK